MGHFLAFLDGNWVCLGLFFWGLKAVHFHNPFVKKRLRSFWALKKLALNWVCLFGLRNHLFFCNPLL